MSVGASNTLRVRPRVWIGLIMWLVYTVGIFGIQRATGVPFPELGENGYNLFWGAGLSLIIGTALLAITTTFLGWWRPALIDGAPSAHRWLIVFPAIVALFLIDNLTVTDWGQIESGLFGAREPSSPDLTRPNFRRG